MEALHAVEFFCPKCSAKVDAAAPVCPQCGASLESSTATSDSATEPRDVLDNPWLVLGMLFLATGALGLPFLWRSKGFAPWAKVVIGVAVTIYTAILIGLAAWAMLWAWRNTLQAFPHLVGEVGM